MSEAWKTYAHAPASGARICAAGDVPASGTLCLDLAGYPLLLLRVGGRVRAYVNACPHQYLPLDHRGPKLLSADGRVLRCTNHGAGFSAETGEGVEGLGLGCALDPVPVRETEFGDLVIGER